MKKDILTKTDIIQLVDKFYDRVKTDPLLGPYFIDLVKINWAKHLPVMYTFWENVLFHTGTYDGNPMQIHKAMHDKFPMRTEHFQQWLRLFTSTVDDLFAGNNAEVIKQRATSIATVMQIKILY